jgi:3-phenylpropionate/trans-cinnamate dioxygenase ferredoxin reductase component
MHSYDYLIVGGGMTADAAAHGIREVDSRGSIGMISSEPDQPYNRPPLSKALWKGEQEQTIWRDTAETNAEMHLGRTVTRLDPSKRTVIDDKGERYEYGSLLLATGGTPRRLPYPADDIIYYRTFGDYRRLRELTTRHDTFAVIGGGFIGSEIAAALAMNGKTVRMIFPEHGIGARVFPGDLAKFLVDYYGEKGVEVRTGTSVESIASANGARELRTTAGQTLRADAIVAGLGILPNVDLAKAAGIETGDGILVDERLRASQDRIFAAGDVASFVNPMGQRVRVEHEDNAVTMGRAAGRSMAGDATPYEHLPFFYSDLFDLGYEAVGTLDSRLETYADWKEPYREGVIYYLADGRVRGVLLWNVWGHVDTARALIKARGPFAPEQLKGKIPA